MHPRSIPSRLGTAPALRPGPTETILRRGLNGWNRLEAPLSAFLFSVVFLRGPFTPYVFDLCERSSKSYANDDALYVSGPDLAELMLKFKHDIQLLTNWSNHNRLSLNFSKSNFMCISSKSMLRRITIIKVNHKLYLLSFIRKNLPTFGAVLLYKTMIIPYFNYCKFLLHLCSAKTKFEIQRLQRLEGMPESLSTR